MKRTKRRYLAIRWEYGTLNAKELMNALWSSVTKLFGEFGASLASLALIDFDEGMKWAIIRGNLVALGMIKTSIASIISTSNRPIVLNVVAVSGTVKGLSQNFLREKQK